MIDIPVMKPSAAIRVGKAIIRWDGDSARIPAKFVGEVVSEVEAAFHDGALVEREHILSLLREPNEEFIKSFITMMPFTTMMQELAIRAAPELAARAILNALAAHLENAKPPAGEAGG